MTTPLQALILGANFQVSLAAAVADAVRQADAAGLLKAYKSEFMPGHDQLPASTEAAK